MSERISDRGQEILRRASECATEVGARRTATEHVLLALMRDENSLCSSVMSSLDIEADEVVSGPVDTDWAQGDGGDGSPYTRQLAEVITASLRHALSFGHNSIEPEHLLIGLASCTEGAAYHALRAGGTDAESIRARLAEAIDAERDAYFTSLPVRKSPAFRRVLITAISRTRASPDGELDVTDLLLVLAQDREIPVLRRLNLDEATVRRAIRDAPRP